MKTALALLLMTDGRPLLQLDDMAKLFGVDRRTLMNRIYAKALPFPTWKEGGAWVARVDDVAQHIDRQRDAAAKEMAVGGS